jgi:hypothetical protein
MITIEDARRNVLAWLQVQEHAMNSFGSALPGYAKRRKHHLMIREEATEEHDFGWVFFWNTRAYIVDKDFSAALGGNAPLIVSREDGSIHITGTARQTSYYIDEYRKNKKEA